MRATDRNAAFVVKTLCFNLVHKNERLSFSGELLAAARVAYYFTDMVERLALYAKQALLVIVTLTMVVVGASAMAHENAENVFPLHEVTQNVVLVEHSHTDGHAHHKQTETIEHFHRHKEHTGDCHSGICCIMDCQYEVDKSLGGSMHGTLPKLFAVVLRALHSHPAPDRPPRNS